MAKEKITTRTRVKSVAYKTSKKGTIHDVKFEYMDFSGQQIQRLRELLEDKTEIMITIEPVNEQSKLPLKKD
jgi:hypothetical protein